VTTEICSFPEILKLPDNITGESNADIIAKVRMIGRHCIFKLPPPVSSPGCVLIPNDTTTQMSLRRVEVTNPSVKNNGLYVPTGQVVQADWPDALYVPPAQAIQADDEMLPVKGLKVPAVQAAQAGELLNGLKNPAAQVVQAVEEVLLIYGLYVPAGQAMQAVEEVLPVDGLYVPAEHAVQADWPAML
jgi:hypothetical protein